MEQGTYSLSPPPPPFAGALGLGGERMAGTQHGGLAQFVGLGLGHDVAGVPMARGMLPFFFHDGARSGVESVALLSCVCRPFLVLVLVSLADSRCRPPRGRVSACVRARVGSVCV